MKNRINITNICLLMAVSVAFFVASPINAQETNIRQQAWRYGLNLGVQSNSAGLGWQSLHGSDGNFHAPSNNIDYVDGTGIGAYFGLFGEYLSDSWWGFQLRMSYDMRNALVEDQSRTPVPSFDTKISYLSIAPSFRVDQKLIPNLSFTIGPIVNLKLNGSYIYKPDIDKSGAESKIDIPDFNSLAYGFECGFAYDFKAAIINEKSSVYISPFADASWLVHQRKSPGADNQNSFNDIWSTMSYRLGVRLSIDYRKDAIQGATGAIAPEPKNKLYVMMPTDNTILTKNVKGYFPIHQYVFFDKGSQEIPVRYVMLSKADATNFKESDLSNFMKGDLTVKETNVNQLMTTYYNVMNVYGDRMRNNPYENLVLRGSDPDGIDGEADAKKVKSYLVDSFGINPDRITIVVEPPMKPSGTAYTNPAYKGMIDDENRRVVFLFTNPDMYKPIPYTIRDESSIDNDMVFAIGDSVAFKYWDITITGEDRSMYFGPFAYNAERINPSELMRFLSSGTYNAKVTITDLDGNEKIENVKFKLVKSAELKNASRYLMIFDYNKSDAVLAYETKIRGEIVPGILAGNKVIVHGHSDIIGNQVENRKLSIDRANEAKRIIDDELTKESKTNDVKAIGLGQSKSQYTFDNRYPEGRMYNRNIFVEVIE